MKIQILALALMLTAASCHKCDDQPEVPQLPGTWQEVEEAPQFAGSTSRITFVQEGSFRLKRRLFSDAIDPTNPPCGANRTQYVRGTYTVTPGSSLEMAGRYCDSNFTKDVPDCGGATAIREHYTLSGGGGGSIILDNERGEYYRIRLVRQ